MEGLNEMKEREQQLKDDLKKAEGQVAEVERAVQEAGKALLECPEGDTTTRGKVLTDYWNMQKRLFELATEKVANILGMQKALTDQMSAAWNQEKVDILVARSPPYKFLLDFVASADAASVFHWDFEAVKQVTQSDRVPNFREKIARHYFAWKNSGDCKCQLSGVWGNGRAVVAAHLLKHATKQHLKDLFSIDDINDPRNALMLCKGIEQAFETGRIYFVQNGSDRIYLMKAWDPAVLEEPIHDGSSMKIGELVGKKLTLPKSVDPPYKRVLSDHAQRSYLHAQKKKWIEPTVEKPVEYGSPLKDNVLSITKMSTPTGDDQSDLDA